MDLDCKDTYLSVCSVTAENAAQEQLPFWILAFACHPYMSSIWHYLFWMKSWCHFWYFCWTDRAPLSDSWTTDITYQMDTDPCVWQCSVHTRWMPSKWQQLFLFFLWANASVAPSPFPWLFVSVPHHHLVQTSQRTIGQAIEQMEIQQPAEITDGYPPHPFVSTTTDIFTYSLQSLLFSLVFLSPPPSSLSSHYL